MNKAQHIFIWVGIGLLTFMAISFDSTLTWLIAALALIAESIYLCKNLSGKKIVLLILAILIFVIIFINSLPHPKILR